MGKKGDCYLKYTSRVTSLGANCCEVRHSESMYLINLVRYCNGTLIYWSHWDIFCSNHCDMLKSWRVQYLKDKIGVKKQSQVGLYS